MAKKDKLVNDISVRVEKIVNGECLIDEKFSTLFSLGLKNDGKMAVSFFGMYTKEIIKQMELESKKYFKMLRKEIKNLPENEDEIKVLQEDLEESKKLKENLQKNTLDRNKESKNTQKEEKVNKKNTNTPKSTKKKNLEERVNKKEKRVVKTTQK